MTVIDQRHHGLGLGAMWTVTLPHVGLYCKCRGYAWHSMRGGACLVLFPPSDPLHLSVSEAPAKYS